MGSKFGLDVVVKREMEIGRLAHSVTTILTELPGPFVRTGIPRVVKIWNLFYRLIKFSCRSSILQWIQQILIFNLLSLFWKINIGLCDLRAVCVCFPPPINFWMAEPIFMKLGMYNMASELISTAYFINPFHHSVCLCEYPNVVRQRPVKNTPIVPEQRHCKNVAAETNSHARIEELLDASFSMRSVSYQRK
jgi:hypothetical protein